MIESVQARQRGAFNFEDHYENLCALQDSAPMPAVKANLAQGVIDLNGDKIRLNDWQPIIGTIRINKSLKFIAVRSYFEVSSEEDEKRAAILRRKLPAIRSKEITHRLVKALKECLFASPALSCIELRGLALRDRDLQVLVKGILKSQALRHLSLEYCRIGDQGLEILCKGLKNTTNINSVNLSGCSLSHRGAESLASVIKHQGMLRHSEAWRDSLRYRRPDLDRMSGVRRLTANNNPMLGDQGARMLAEALKDDLWLKALDLQACGITSQGAKSFLEVLNYNTTLVILDLRRNALIDGDILHSVMEQLMLNSNCDDGQEYKWMKAEEEVQEQRVKLTGKSGHRASKLLNSSKAGRRTTKILNSSIGKKTTIKVTPTSSRCRPRGSAAAGRRLDMTPSPGLPWRTAARANRFRGHPPDVPRHLTDQSADEPISPGNNNNNGDQDDDDDAYFGTNIILNFDDDKASSHMKQIAAETAAAIQKLEESHLSMDLSNQKEVLIELEQMRRHLREERLTRAKADQRVLQLMIDNRRLSEEVAAMKRSRGKNQGILDDESFLESIETSFRQFHAFIDMLKEAGLGQLVTMAGLDPSQMPFSNGTKHAPASANFNISRSTSNIVSDRGPNPSLDTTYANVPLASSAFVTGQQRSSGCATTVLPVTSMSVASFTEESPLVIGSGVIQDPVMPSSYHDDSGAVAKKEADDLYTRLVQETRSTLGQYTGTGARGTTYVRSTGSVNVAQALAEEEARKLEGQSASRDKLSRRTVQSPQSGLNETAADYSVVDTSSDQHEQDTNDSQDEDF